MTTTQSPAELDLSLIQETLRGNPDAFGKLMHKHHELALGTAIRILGNAQEAEDVVQHAFIEAFRHLADFRGGAQFSTWLYSIVLNQCRNHIRRRKRQATYSLDATKDSDTDAQPMLQVADSTPSHDEVLERKSETEWIREKVQTLSPDYRDIFILHYYQDLSLQDIANQLNRPLNTVKVYLHRARKELFELWNQRHLK